jgi:hypothetical protein
MKISCVIIAWSFVQQTSFRFISLIVMFLVTPKAAAKLELLFNKPTSGNRGWFVGRRLVLSLSFRCDQIHICHRYDFSRTLLCYLSRTWMFNKPTSAFSWMLCGRFVEQKLMLSSTFRRDQIHNHRRYAFSLNCCAIEVRLSYSTNPPL